MPPDLPSSPAVPSTRKRYAKSEIARALRALEMVEDSDFDLAMRVLYLEDQVTDLNETAAEWRRKYMAVKKIAAAMGRSTDV